MLNSYDDTLPLPMPEEMRAMWQVARAAQWRVGETSMRLLSPKVVAGRAKHRAALAESHNDVAEHLDVLVVAGDKPMLTFDVRQLNLYCWFNEDAGERDLADALGAQFLNPFVTALVKLCPQLKKLNHGQSIADGKPRKKKAK
jgi:hypothetical protein